MHSIRLGEIFDFSREYRPMQIFEPGEMVTLALMLVGVGVTVANYRHIRAWRFARLACAWFVLWLLASALTIAEDMLWPESLNLAQHALQACAAMLLLFALKDFVRLGGGGAQ